MTKELPQRAYDLVRDYGDEIERFLDSYCSDELAELWQKYPKEKKDVWIDFSDVLKWHPEIAECIAGENESYTTKTIKEAFAATLVEMPNPANISPLWEELEIRFYNLNPAYSYSVGGYWAEDLGNYMAVTGQVAKATSVQPNYIVRAFECGRCGTVTEVPQPPGEEVEANSCDNCDRGGPFYETEERSEVENYQRLRLEELPEETRGDDSAELDVIIRGDLVKWLQERNIKSGSRITVNGVLGSETSNGVRRWVIEAHAIELEDDDFTADTITTEEREQIQAYARGEHGDPFELLAQSVAPSIKGHEKIPGITYNGQEQTKWWWIKVMGALAHLFQGWRKQKIDGTYRRGASHMLLMGDPSTGKSTFMQSIEELSPRFASATGKDATAAGMTAAAVQDDFGGGNWMLEAGVLVKGHKGVATIDEIDKVRKDAVSSMHSAMEKQRINVAKAGINATLPCETSVLASGNPKESRFSDYGGQSDFDQVDLVSSLLDRFDLVFLLKDPIEEERDREIASHVLDSHEKAGRAERGDIELEDAKETGAIESDLLRKWVKIAREIKPVLEKESVKTDLEEFYVNIRQSNKTDGEESETAVPATVRSLDGVLRLAEAAARFRLSDTIEQIDADLAKAGIEAYLQDIGYDSDTGEIDIDYITGHTPQQERTRRQRIIGIVKELSGEKGAEWQNVIETVASTENMDHEKAAHEVEKLMQSGDLMEPRTGYLRVV